MQPRGELDRTDRKLIENLGDSPEDKGNCNKLTTRKFKSLVSKSTSF